MLSGDPDDDWSRLRADLRERQRVLKNEITSGDLDPSRYQNLCGRVAQIDETIERMGQIRRGEDLKPPERERLKSVEE